MSDFEKSRQRCGIYAFRIVLFPWKSTAWHCPEDLLATIVGMLPSEHQKTPLTLIFVRQKCEQQDGNTYSHADNNMDTTVVTTADDINPALPIIRNVPYFP